MLGLDGQPTGEAGRKAACPDAGGEVARPVEEGVMNKRDRHHLLVSLLHRELALYVDSGLRRSWNVVQVFPYSGVIRILQLPGPNHLSPAGWAKCVK